MKPISSYRDLVSYQKAFTLQQSVFGASKKFPKEKPIRSLTKYAVHRVP